MQFNRVLLCAALAATSTSVNATDILRTGSDPVLGLRADPLSAIAGNPALLPRVVKRNQFSLTALSVDSRFISKLGEKADAEKGPGLLPEFAIARHLGDTKWHWGAGFTIHSAMRADFEFTDPPGALGVSYGRQTHRAEYVVAKIGGALAYTLNEQLTVGVSLGLAYNRNQLESPYIFQSHPVLQNLKVLVDLDADDLAVSTTIGFDYAPCADWHFSLAFSPETRFSADGDLSGNLGQLGLGIQEDFSYDATVKTTTPASLVASAIWQTTDRLQLGVQLDWINWNDAFVDLPIRLTQGTNTDLNAFLGQNSINDTAPLNWKDQHVVHVGGNFSLPTGQQLRFGAERGNIVVPRATATPMTGAILETAYSLGLSFGVGGSLLDIYYRFSDSPGLKVQSSALRAGEYSGTRQSLSLHSLGLTYSF